SPGVAHTFSIGTAGTYAMLLFSGNAGDRFSVWAHNSSFSGLVTVLEPNGSTLGSGNINGGSAYVDAVTLPVSGTYAVLVDPSSNQTGSATLNLYSVQSDVAGTLQPSVSPGTSQSLSFSTPGQNAALTFSGTQGQKVSLAISNWSLGS